MLAGQVITGRKKLVKGTILIKKLENPISERQVVLLVCLFQVVEVHTQHQHGHLAGFFFLAFIKGQIHCQLQFLNSSANIYPAWLETADVSEGVYLLKALGSCTFI